MNPRHFFSELQRRNVYKVAVAYGVVAWLLIQVATQTFPFFEIPSWVVRAVILLLLLGFPIALVFAWIFELTPEGIKRTDEVPPNESITHKTGRRFMAIVSALAALAVALFLFRFARSNSAIVRAAATGSPSTAASAMSIIPEKSIAVLPFENRSSDKENAFFADGVQDEVLTILAKVADLKVISRTSVMQFRDAEKRNLRNIAQQLGVAYVLEGSVQRTANRVRVTAQLIDTRTDSHVWADRYDGDLADVFGIQTEIAQKIAGQLKAALSPKEQAALQTKPTLDTAAYDLYLRAKEISRGSEGDAIQKEVTLLDEAVTRDPAFVPALCLLAQAHLRAYWFNQDHTPARLELASKAIEAAARLQPDAGEVHLARGLFYYWGSGDYASALAELVLAGRSLPNEADVLFFTGAIERRRGHWEQSARTMERALVLDPRNGNVAVELSITYSALRRYNDERRVLIQLLRAQIGPENEFNNVWAQVSLAYAEFYRTGDLAAGKEILRKIPVGLDPVAIVTLARWHFSMLERDFGAAEKILAEFPSEEFPPPRFPKSYYQAHTALARDDAALARSLFEKAIPIFELRVHDRSDDAVLLASLGELYAYLGRKEDAIRVSRRAVELVPESKDAEAGPYYANNLALVYARMDEADQAIALIERLLSTPAGVIFAELRLSWEWDPLRNHPRFQKILEGPEPKTVYH